MQVNIGEKIRKLRKRDKRKQEDLANALGVSAQAVSRWESGGGFPDMTLIPCIANYFHITIDELFGYNNDREAKIDAYLSEANRALLENSDKSIKEAIVSLRKALEEFPEEPRLKLYLAHGLDYLGRREKDIHNPYVKEAIALYEELYPENKAVLYSLLMLYSETGQYEKAEKTASEQPEFSNCRKILLAKIFGSEKQEKYRGEAVLALLHELCGIMCSAVPENKRLEKSEEGIGILKALRHMYDVILGEDFTGMLHGDLILIDLTCAGIAAAANKRKQAAELFDSAYGQYLRFKKAYEERSEDHYDTPLLSKVSDVTDMSQILWQPEVIRCFVEDWPEDLVKKVLKGKEV